MFKYIFSPRGNGGSLPPPNPARIFHKRKISKYGLRIIILILLSIFVTQANAGDIDTKYVKSIIEIAPTWTMTIMPAATKLFTLLWFAETMLQGIFNHLFQVGRIRELLRFVIVRCLFLGFFTAVMLKPNLYLGIIQYLSQLGGGNKTSGITGIDAGLVWSNYTQWHTSQYQPYINSLSWYAIATQLSASFADMVFLFATAYISFLVIMIEIEVSCLVYGGLILTGCAGSQWTKGWWNSYLGSCVSIGLKVMIFCLLYSVLGKVMEYNPNISKGDIWTQVVNCLICTLALGVVPGKIAGIVSGAGTGNLGGTVIGGALAAMAFSKRIAGGISSAGQSSVSFHPSTLSNSSASSNSRTSLANVASEAGGALKQPQANLKDKTDFLNGKNGKN